MAFSDPRFILDQCGLSEGRTVVDCGCGDGAYTLEASKLVGDIGTVYAIDIQQDVVTRLKNTLRSNHIKNVHVIHSDIDEPAGTKLHDGTVDLVCLCNVFFQLDHRETMVAEINRILKPNGRVLFVDWSETSSIGPAKDRLVLQKAAQNYFTHAKFTQEKELQAGDHHYGLIFRKL